MNPDRLRRLERVRRSEELARAGDLADLARREQTAEQATERARQDALDRVLAYRHGAPPVVTAEDLAERHREVAESLYRWRVQAEALSQAQRRTEEGRRALLRANAEVRRVRRLVELAQAEVRRSEGRRQLRQSDERAAQRHGMPDPEGGRRP